MDIAQKAYIIHTNPQNHVLWSIMHNLEQNMSFTNNDEIELIFHHKHQQRKQL